MENRQLIKKNTQDKKIEMNYFLTHIQITWQQAMASVELTEFNIMSGEILPHEEWYFQL